jgi:hypothetical protein
MEGDEDERASKGQTPERVNVKTRPKRGLADLRRRMTDACIDRVRRCDKHALLARCCPFGEPLRRACGAGCAHTSPDGHAWAAAGTGPR